MGARDAVSGTGVIQGVTVLGWVLVMEEGWQGRVGTYFVERADRV